MKKYKKYLFYEKNMLQYFSKGERKRSKTLLLKRKMKNTYLLSLKISGIKNIERPIELNFYKKTIDKNFDSTDYRVKSIYGGNGTGKTGLITAVDIMKKIILDDTYLSDRQNQFLLDDIINKKTKEFSIECEILSRVEENLYVIKYEMLLNQDKSGQFKLGLEKMSYKNGNYPNDNYKLIYVVEDGKLDGIKWSKYREEYENKTLNLLKKQSFVSNHMDFVIEEKFENKVEFILLVGFTIFALNIRVYLEEDDKHDDYTFRKIVNSYRDDMTSKTKDKDELFQTLQNIIGHPLNINKTTILKERFKEYKNQIKMLEKFIKIFKSDLKGIRIDKKENGEFYNTSLVLQYEGYEVDEEFESRGIVKLISLFECFNYSNKGGTVFIDEMDSNINDVYYCKLVEYFMNYGEGQLIFTTHNVESMNALKEKKMSIDFLSSINTLYSWKKNGNFTPDNLFRNGMIKDIPFNVDATDFIGIFEET